MGNLMETGRNILWDKAPNNHRIKLFNRPGGVGVVGGVGVGGRYGEMKSKQTSADDGG